MTTQKPSTDRRFARRADRVIDGAKGSIAPLGQLQAAALYGACQELDSVESQMLTEIASLRWVLDRAEAALLNGASLNALGELQQTGRDFDRNCALRHAGIQGIVRLCAAMSVPQADLFTEQVRP